MINSHLRVLVAVTGSVTAINKYIDPTTKLPKPRTPGMGCAECLLSGYIYCKQRGWWEVITSTTSVDEQLPKALKGGVTLSNYGICCDPNSYACENEAGTSLAPSEKYVCNKYSPSDDARKNDGFTDLALAVSACQHKTSICGEKIINLDDTTAYPNGKVTL